MMKTFLSRYFCQATDGAQTSQSSVEKPSFLCSYKKAVAKASSGMTVITELDSYLIKTRKSEKKAAIDEQIARMIYAANSPFWNGFYSFKESNFLSLLVNFKAEAAPFQIFMLCDNIVQTIKPCNW